MSFFIAIFFIIASPAESLAQETTQDQLHQRIDLLESRVDSLENANETLRDGQLDNFTEAFNKAFSGEQVVENADFLRLVHMIQFARQSGAADHQVENRINALLFVYGSLPEVFPEYVDRQYLQEI